MTISEVLEELGIDIAPPGHHHVGEGWVGLDCPFCSPGTGAFRCGIPEDTKGSVNCWSCGPHRLWETLSEASGRPIREVAALCGGMVADRPAERILDARGRLVLPFDLGKLKKAHRNYLRDRHFDPKELVRLWGIQGIGPLGGVYAWRVFIPVRRGQDTVSFTTRAICDDVELRYRTAKPSEEKISSRSLLYGSELARNAIVICEGPLDAWSIGPGAVATLGTGYSQTQLALMAAYPVRAVCFDAERDGQRRAKKLVRDLEAFDGDTYNIELDSGKDTNECLKSSKGRREVRRIRKMFLAA